MHNYNAIFNSFNNKEFSDVIIDHQEIKEIQFCYSVNYFLACILASRNINILDIDKFLNPKIKNHFPNIDFFLDIDKCIKRIIAAILKKEKICIFGDYDVDGSAGSALLFRFFKSLDQEVIVYIPDRTKEGYGLNINAIDKIKLAAVSLMITVDCGTTAIKEIEYSNTKKLDVIVLDHHFCDNIPPAVAVINPNRIDNQPGYEYLCGSGVAFVVLAIIQKELETINYYKNNNLNKINLLDLVELVAIATIADVVPLVGLNRAFVHLGLKQIIQYKKNLGIKALISLLKNSKINSGTIAFQVAPRINASGRIGESSLGYDILSSDDAKVTTNIAERLELYNLTRREMEAKITKEAEVELMKFLGPQDIKSLDCIFLGSYTWHNGLIGIIAARLKEKYNKVTIIYSINNDSCDNNSKDNNDLCGSNSKDNNDSLKNNKDLTKINIHKASARSIYGIDLGKIITNAKLNNLILEGGGHKAAGGFSFLQSKKDQLIEFFNIEIKKQQENNTKEILRYFILPHDSVTIETAKDVLKLEPFGSSNREPLFRLMKVKIKNLLQIKEKIFKMHIILDNKKSIDTILFDKNNTQNYIAKNNKEFFDIIVTLEINHFTGNLQLNLQDILLV